MHCGGATRSLIAFCSAPWWLLPCYRKNEVPVDAIWKWHKAKTHPAGLDIFCAQWYSTSDVFISVVEDEYGFLWFGLAVCFPGTLRMRRPSKWVYFQARHSQDLCYLFVCALPSSSFSDTCICPLFFCMSFFRPFFWPIGPMVCHFFFSRSFH